MDPNTLPTPNFDMPTPRQGAEQPAPQEAPVSTERGTAELPLVGSPAPQPLAPQPSVPVTPLPPAAGSAVPASVTPPLEAEDSDLIEKAWVDKAKAIVSQTRTDPHQQNTEINKVKAEYIKKRYNKDIKVNDE